MDAKLVDMAVLSYVYGLSPRNFMSSASSYSIHPVIMSSASSLLKERIRKPEFLDKIRDPNELIDLFSHGTSIGWSGFTGVWAS